MKEGERKEIQKEAGRRERKDDKEERGKKCPEPSVHFNQTVSGLDLEHSH